METVDVRDMAFDEGVLEDLVCEDVVVVAVLSLNSGE